jgi:hypothetical protein
MTSESATSEKARRLTAHFFVPFQIRDRLKPIAEISASVRPEFQRVAKAFEHNLESLLESLSLPFTLASSSATDKMFSHFLMAEKIRARAIDNTDIPSGASLDHHRDQIALTNAMAKAQQFNLSDVGRDRLMHEVCDFLLEALDNGNLTAAASQLREQAIVMLWSAFEVLFRDVIECELNLNPAKCTALAADTVTRKRIESKVTSLETLIENNFDLSRRVGTLVVAQNNFSDLPSIKTISVSLFPQAESLRLALDEKSLWLLYQRRHLFVHRRGIIDRKYLEGTSDEGEEGARLNVTPNQFEGHFDSVLKAGVALLASLSN